MARGESERLDYRDRGDDWGDQVGQAYDKVLEGKATAEDLQACLYGVPLQDIDTEDRAKWNLIQDGLGHDKLDDRALEDFARAVGDYTNEVREELRDMLNDKVKADERDSDLKQVMGASIDIQVMGYALETVVTRSNYYPFQGSDDPTEHMDKYRTLGIMATHDEWDLIPAKVRELSESDQGT